MKISELFINLGLKGSDKTIGDLGKTKTLLGEASTKALLLKAGLVGAFYGMERLFSASGQIGTGLKNFNAALGVSTQTLEQYQYAARQVGLTNEEVTQSFSQLQSVAAGVAAGGAAPSGFGAIATILGGLNDTDMRRFSEKPEEFLLKLQEATQTAMAQGFNTGLINEWLRSFGVSDNMIAAFRRNAFTPEVLARAPVRSQGEIDALHGADVASKRLADTVERSLGRISIAANREGMINDIEKIALALEKATTAVLKFGKAIKAGHWISESVRGWTLIFQGLATAVETASNILSEDPEKNKKGASTVDKWFESVSTMGNYINSQIPDSAKYIWEKLTPQGRVFNQLEKLAPILEKGFEAGNARPVMNAKPSTPPILPSDRTPIPDQTFNINQTFNFDDHGDNAFAIGESVGREVKDAYIPLTSRAQVG